MKKVNKILSLLLTTFAFVGLVGCKGNEEVHSDVLTISCAKEKAAPGEVVDIETKFNDEVITPTYTFESGAKYATIANNKLKVLDNAINGAEIVFYATYQEVESNKVHIDVEKEAKTLVATISSDKLIPGSTATLTAKLSGADCDATYEFVNTVDFATISGNTLTVKEDAKVGSAAQIVAKSGEYTSAPILFSVIEDAGKTLTLSLKKDTITVDATTTSPANNQLGFDVYDKDGNAVTNLSQFNNEITVKDTLGLVDYTVSDGVITFAPKAHGKNDITISLTHDGVISSELLDVTSIKVPETIALPEAFNSTRYTVGMYNAVGDADKINVAPIFTGTDVCEDYNVSFKKDNQETTKAHYDKVLKAMSFEEAGTYTAIFETNSGAEAEKKLEKTIIVNEGKNVRTYEELKDVCDNLDSNDYENCTVSVVNVLNNLLVDGKVYKNAAKIADSTIRAFGSFDIHGNGFTIDTTTVPIISSADRIESNVDGIGALIRFHPYAKSIEQDYKYVETGEYKDFTISIDELNLIGNCSTKTTMQEILKMPGKTDDECLAAYAQLNETQKKAILSNEYEFGFNIGSVSEYVNVGGQNYKSGIKGHCSRLLINDCYISGFAKSCICCDEVMDAHINNCILENSFASTLTLKGGKYELENDKFKSCGMFSVEFDARAQILSGTNALPIYEYGKYLFDTNIGNGLPAAIGAALPYLVKYDQGIKFIGCDFDNWADGTSLNASVGLNPLQYLAQVYTGNRQANQGQPTYIETITSKQNDAGRDCCNLEILENAYTYLVSDNSFFAQTNALLAQASIPAITPCYTKFVDKDGNDIKLEIPFGTNLYQVPETSVGATVDHIGFEILQTYYTFIGRVA